MRNCFAFIKNLLEYLYDIAWFRFAFALFIRLKLCLYFNLSLKCSIRLAWLAFCCLEVGQRFAPYFLSRQTKNNGCFLTVIRPDITLYTLAFVKCTIFRLALHWKFILWLITSVGFRNIGWDSDVCRSNNTGSLYAYQLNPLRKEFEDNVIKLHIS